MEHAKISTTNSVETTTSQQEAVAISKLMAPLMSIGMRRRLQLQSGT